MTGATPDITALLVARADGPRIGISFHSMLDAVSVAQDSGLSVELLVVLAGPNRSTREALADAERHGARVAHVDAGHPSVVRNRAVQMASGSHIAMIDDASLWSENWLVAAHAVCRTDPRRVIVHPETYWFFEQTRDLYFPPDQTHPQYDPAFLRVANAWDVRCMAPASVYQAVPFAVPAVDDEPGDEEWHWSLETVAAGFVHRVAPETLHFKRQRPESLFLDPGSLRSIQPYPSRSLQYRPATTE